MTKTNKKQQLWKRMLRSVVMGALIGSVGLGTMTASAYENYTSSNSAHLEVRVLAPIFPGLKHKPIPSSVEIKQVDAANPMYVNEGLLAIVKKDGKYGILNTNGKEKVAPKYKSIESYEKEVLFSAYEKKKTPLILDKTGKEYTLDEYSAQKAKAITKKAEVATTNDQVAMEQPGKQGAKETSYVAVKKNKLWGFVDQEGRQVIEPKFKDVLTGFSEGIAYVKTSRTKKVAIDTKGNILFEIPYDEIAPFENGLAEYRRRVGNFNVGALIGFMGVGLSKGGDTHLVKGITGGFDYDGVKRGYLDRHGNIIIDSKNDAVYPITAYGTIVKNDGLVSFVDRQGKTVIPPGKYNVGALDTKTALLTLEDKESDKFGLFTVLGGEQIIPFKYDKLEFLGGDRLYAKADNSSYLVDLHSGTSLKTFLGDVKIVPFTYENYTWLDTKDKDYKIIDTDGKVLVDSIAKTFSEPSPFRLGYSVVKVDGKYGIVDKNGQWVVPAQYDSIELL